MPVKRTQLASIEEDQGSYHTGTASNNEALRGPDPPTASRPAGGPLAALAPRPVAGCKGATQSLLCRLSGRMALERVALRDLAGTHGRLGPLLMDISSKGPAIAVLILMI